MCRKMSLVNVHCDGEGAINLTTNQNTIHRRTKHIDIKFNFIWDEVDDKRLSLVKVSTKDNPTDMMTKPFPTNKFTLCVDLVGLAPYVMWSSLRHYVVW